VEKTVDCKKTPIEEWLNDPENFKIFTTKLIKIDYEVVPRVDAWEYWGNLPYISLRKLTKWEKIVLRFKNICRKLFRKGN